MQAHNADRRPAKPATNQASIPLDEEFGDVEAERGFAVGRLEIGDHERHADLELGPVGDALEFDVARGTQPQLFSIVGSDSQKSAFLGNPCDCDS